jgi:hypothetical protein
MAWASTDENIATLACMIRRERLFAGLSRERLADVESRKRETD